jgi:uncharacterized protein (TIGR02246 family)
MERPMTDSHAAGDELAIRDLLTRLAEAWDRGDPDAYGALFTDDARYIAYFGGIYRGRREIAESHRVLWAGVLKGTRMFWELVEIRFVTADIVLAVSRGDVGKKRPRKLPKIQSFVVARQPDGRWLLTHFQNTRRAPLIQFLAYRAGESAIPSLDR